MKKLLKVATVLALMLTMVGCASIASYSNKVIENKKEGIVYGVGGVASDLTAKQLCEIIKNKDNRCDDSENYEAFVLTSKFGFADGNAGVFGLVRKDFPNIQKIKNIDKNIQTHDKKAPYVKARVVAGQLGELLDIVQTDGNGDCYWSGLPRAGGVVCPSVNYDYRKDFQGVVR